MSKATIIIHKKSMRVMASIETLEKRVASSLIRSLYFIGPTLVKEGRRLMATAPKTGRLYKIKGMIHQASAPFEAPANLTGRMSDSLHSTVHGADQLEYGSALSRSEPPYPMFLEHGTRKMKPRQLLLQVVNNKARDMQDILEAGIKKELESL